MTISIETQRKVEQASNAIKVAIQALDAEMNHINSMVADGPTAVFRGNLKGYDEMVKFALELGGAIADATMVETVFSSIVESKKA